MDERHQIASRALDAQRDGLSEAIVARQYEVQGELWKPYGTSGHQKSLRDAGYHLAYLSEALAVASPSLFSEYVAWVKALFAGLQFPDEVLVTILVCTRDALREELDPESSALTTEYVELALDHMRQAPVTVPAFLDQQAPLGGLALEYLDALLHGERHVASQLVLDAVEQGTGIKDVYLHVFQPSQYEIGRLWQMNRITVAQEHYCTAATQLIMSQLYPRLFGTERIGRRLVATCVGDELHELGVRMVADFFEIEGWDTYYLGANTPTESVLRALKERQAEVLAVSATMTFHVSAVADLVSRVRGLEGGKEGRILVGGYPFNLSPGLWRRVGADGYAPDAPQAVALVGTMEGAAR